MPYKLMIAQQDGSYITGQELFNILATTGFTVPVKVPYIAPIKPVAPPRPAVGATMEQRLHYYNVLKPAYDQAWITWSMEVNARQAAYFKQFADFEQVLRDKFILMTGVMVSRNPVTYDYQEVKPCLYSFAQCANRLMGAYNPAPADPVDFICFGKF